MMPHSPRNLHPFCLHRKRQKRSLDQPRTRHQSSRHGSGVSMQRGGNRHAAISDDDELPDVQNGSDWRYAMVGALPHTVRVMSYTLCVI